MTAGGTARPARAVVSWCLYDWANSAFPTIIGTFVFATYFTKAVAENEVAGTEAWGYAIGIAGLLAAVLSPVLGAIADNGGRRKPWLAAMTALCVGATALLWYTEPDPAFVTWAVVLVVLASLSFEIGQVFYNAMLPGLAPLERTGRVSGWGWGLGYAGGLGCLVLCLVALVQTETPWFGLSTDNAENIRAVTLVVAVWFAVFSVPLFLFTPDTPSRGQPWGAAVREGLATLIATLRQIRRYGNIARFLLARMLYTDGLNALFAFGGIYAAGTFGFTTEQIIVFGIAINVTAGLGAAAFAWVDDWIGPKKTILIALVCLTGLGGGLLVAEGQTWFWVLALPLGIFVGPAQAASRSLMARMVPPGMENEMFGLYALSGKATSFIAPAMLGWLTATFDSQRAGMSIIVVLIVLGGLLLAFTVQRPVSRR